MKKTPLFDRHVERGARMAPFGGFHMPIQYTGIIHEHQQTRTAATLFDTCHMGQLHVEGQRALDDLQHIVTCDIDTLDVGQCRYGMMCNETGGVLDDLLVYRLAQDRFMLVVNAGTQESDFEWIQGHASDGTRTENRSSQTAKIDLQGPAAPAILETLVDDPLGGMRFYRFAENRFDGTPVLVSRTGYTGEIGFEVYSDAPTAIRLWDACIAKGAEPAGLGARDTLRLEAGMPLYGHELNPQRNAAQAGFTKALARDKDFIGAEAVRAASATQQILQGIVFEGRQAARSGDTVHEESGTAIGVITSGSFGPSVGKAIAMAYVDREHAGSGRPVAVQTARRTLAGTLCELPFFLEGTARKPISDYLGT